MLIELYGRYQQALKATPFDGQIFDYERNELPKKIDGRWLPYSMMFDDFSRELANSLNELADYAHRLKAWSTLISSMDDDQKLAATQEFIHPIGTVGLTLPYVIRSRFIFSVAHLCHQANWSREGKSWKDDLPLDGEIYFNAAHKYGDEWRSYIPLKRCIEKIGDNAYKKATHDFRNAYNHRFSPRFVIGRTQFVTRKVDTQTGRVSYSFGSTSPFELEIVVTLLREQGKHCAAAFEAFLTLVKEHAVTIFQYQT